MVCLPACMEVCMFVSVYFMYECVFLVHASGWAFVCGCSSLCVFLLMPILCYFFVPLCTLNCTYTIFYLSVIVSFWFFRCVNVCVFNVCAFMLVSSPGTSGSPAEVGCVWTPARQHWVRACRHVVLNSCHHHHPFSTPCPTAGSVPLFTSHPLSVPCWTQLLTHLLQLKFCLVDVVKKVYRQGKLILLLKIIT